MNLISIRKKRRPAIALLLCTGLLGACPPDAVADAGDRLPVPEIQQSKSPVKRTLVGTVTDASTGETLIGVNAVSYTHLMGKNFVCGMTFSSEELSQPVK